MNKMIILCFLSLYLFCSHSLYAEDIEPQRTVKSLKRAVRYYNDGGIKSITETYPNGTTVKKKYNRSGEIQERINSDGSKVLFEFSTEDGRKVVTEITEPQGSKVKRILNNIGFVVVSIYEDRKEEYSYEYDKLGDIKKIVVTKEDGTTEELSPDNNRLLFLKDYGIMEDDDVKMIRDMHDKKYLQNPNKYRDEVMGHRTQKFNPNRR